MPSHLELNESIRMAYLCKTLWIVHEILSVSYFSLFLCHRKNFGRHIKIAPSVRYKSCLSHNSVTNEATLMKFHIKIKHNEKVLGAYSHGQGHSQVKSQIRVLAITQTLLKKIS